VCCNNVAKVQKISETTKYFANYFIKNFKKLRKPSPESGTRFSEGGKRQTNSGQGIPTTEGCQLNLGQRILTTGNLPPNL
jgi:hypothetical protein